MNLVLIGYRGTGKSVLSHILHKKTKLPVVHMDDELALRFGESIPDYVARFGWDEFRNAEEELARELSARSDTIVDTGGGIVEREANRRLLKESGFVVWLQSSPESIISHISGDANRPSLSGSKSAVDEVAEILEQRIPLYKEMAHASIATDSQSLHQSANQIYEHYQEAKTNRI